MLRQIYCSRIVRWIGVIGIALILIAGVAAFACQSRAAHAQMPGQKMMTTNALPLYTKGCSSVDATNNGDVVAALSQCDSTNNFKAVIVALGEDSTAIKAGLRGQGMPYMNRCSFFVCATAQFPANPGDTICYQGFAGTTQTDVKCYTIPQNSSGSTTPLLKLH